MGLACYFQIIMTDSVLHRKKLAACREGTRPVLIQAAQLSELEGLKLEKVFLT